MRIKKLHLENIGVFNSLNLEFQPNKRPDKAEIIMFTGENGTGKSTLLYALASAYNSGSCELLRQRFRTPPLNPLVEVFIEKNNQTISRRITHEASTENNEQTMAFAYSGNRALKSYQFSGIQEITESPFDNALSFVNSTDSAILTKWIVYNKAKEAFALMKNEHAKAEKYRTAIQHIETVISEIVGFKIEIVLETELKFNVVLNIEGQRLELDVLPDGLKSIISWIADLFMRMDRIPNDSLFLERNFILFLDEIDIHLHPAWQRQILPVIQKLFPNAQVFVSTHSPFVVGSVSDAYVYKFKIEKGVSHLDSIEESKAGSSVLLVLDEIFDIDELFDIETETEFDQFYRLRDEIMNDKKNEDKIPEFLELARHLTQKGVDVTGVVGRELRQMSRIINHLTANHCAFCDFFPLGAQSRQTIEHFRPKSQYPKLAYVWHNLFLCCDVCQTAKQEKYDKRLLKPDVTGYEFHRYFIVNQTTGEIKPNPRASIFDQERAKITIEFYDLNKTVRKKARLLEWIKADLQAYELDDLSYRFMFF